MAIRRMINRVQSYAWGSTHMLADLRYQAPPDEPQAELWMGAHQRGPSQVISDAAGAVSLRQYLRDTADLALGPEAADLVAPGAEAFELPYLFKILTAEKGLSIQAHPTREAAVAGFDREERSGILIDAPDRNYRDTNHKPEIICALSDFWGLRGFRPLPDLAAEIGGLIKELPESLGKRRLVLSAFAAHPDAETWKAALEVLVSPAKENEHSQELLSAALAYTQRREAGEPAVGRDNRYWWCMELARQFPNDAGAIAPLYLNVVHLLPGQALYLEAGVLHAYLYGAGVELMANSDNVLRSGATSKHVDVPELLRNLLLTFEAPGVIAPEPIRSGAGHIHRYGTTASEFELVRLTFGEERAMVPLRKTTGPAIVLSIGGVAVVHTRTPNKTGPDAVALSPAESAFVDHQTARFSIQASQDTSVYIACLPGSLQVDHAPPDQAS